MSVIHHPNVVTDGLVYCIDAANKACYSGAGADESTCVDLVKGGVGTLENSGAGFTNDNMGIFAFDGTDDWISQDWDFTLGTGDLTIEFWVKFGAIGGNASVLVSVSAAPSLTHEQIQFGLETAGGNTLTCYLQGTGSKTGGLSWSTDQWYHLVATRISSTMSIYRDTVSLTVSINSTNSGDVAAVSTFIIGNQYSSGAYKHDFNGDCGPIRIYNKGLTAAEVLQNYNATKGRFT